MSYLRFSPLPLFYKHGNFCFFIYVYDTLLIFIIVWSVINGQLLKIQISSSSSSIYRKDFPFTHWIALTCLGKMNLPNISGSKFGVTILFQWSLRLFFYQKLNFWIFVLIIIVCCSKLWNQMALSNFLLFKNGFCSSRSVEIFIIHFRINLSIATKWPAGTEIRITLTV